MASIIGSLIQREDARIDKDLVEFVIPVDDGIYYTVKKLAEMIVDKL